MTAVELKRKNQHFLPNVVCMMLNMLYILNNKKPYKLTIITADTPKSNFNDLIRFETVLHMNRFGLDL